MQGQRKDLAGAHGLWVSKECLADLIQILQHPQEALKHAMLGLINAKTLCQLFPERQISWHKLHLQQLQMVCAHRMKTRRQLLAGGKQTIIPTTLCRMVLKEWESMT